MDPERLAHPLRRARQGDEGVSGGSADTLARPVEEQDAGRGSGGGAGQQPELADGRQEVAEAGHLLVALAAVGEHPAEDAQDGAHPLVDAVEDAEAERRETDAHQVDGQDGVDRFRRDVGQQAVDAEQEDVAVDLRCGRVPGAGRARCLWSSGGAGGLRGRPVSH